MTSPLLISVIVLRSLLSPTKAPVNNAITSQPTNVRPTNKAVTARLDLGGTSVETPSTWVDIRLVTRKGINLIMFANGTVAGSWNQSLTETLGIFRIQSHGRGLVKLKSLKTMKYVAISSTGDIYSTVNSSNQEALMNHAQEENHFYSFSSFLYPADQTHVTRKWLLAIGSKGRMRNATRVLRRHKSHQFQITEIRKNSKELDLKAFLRAIRTKLRTARPKQTRE